MATYLKKLSVPEIGKRMGLSGKLAQKTHATIASWSDEPASQTAAAECFIGDIYSGLRVADLQQADRVYAQEHLRILSGLYGVLRPFDGIMPYRLEMAYRLPKPPFDNLYAYWGRAIAGALPPAGPLLNVSSQEYMKAIVPFVDATRIITPQFLTVSPKTGQPEFVVVHAKIARGAFARWSIVNRVDTVAELVKFDDLGYIFDAQLSQPGQPVFVCRSFGGIGLSVRLT